MSALEVRDSMMMRRALELASKGGSTVSPNPKVGAVLTDADGVIIAEAFHEQYGGPHAEAALLASLSGRDLSECTLYVTLEPCSHQGKTPPCSDLIVESGIGRIVVAMRDPNPLVDGKGNKRLREAGREVVVGLLETEARRLNESWLKFIRSGFPFVTVKIAQSLDGFIALPDGESQWITGELARSQVHELRAQCDAIMIGTRTASHDNPSLTVRHGIDSKQPWRVVLDRSLELSPELKLFSDERKDRTILFTGLDLLDSPGADNLRKLGVKVEGVPVDTEEVNLQMIRVIEYLGSIGVTSVLVEGGAALIDTMIADKLVDKLILFIAPKLLGHGLKPFSKVSAQTLADATLVNIYAATQIGEDVMIESYLT